MAEGCTTNVFVVERTKLFTPAPRDGILPGIVRGRVLEVARERGLILHEGKLRLQRLERAREAFLTSSLGEVRPLVRYQGRPVGNGQPGSLTRALAAEVRKRRAATARGDDTC